jgi:DNA-binding NtrC family response regulator
LTQIDKTSFDIIVLDLAVSQGSTLTVLESAQFRQPDANVVL